MKKVNILLIALSLLLCFGQALAKGKPGGGGGNACDWEFDADFRDESGDGLVSDTLGSYVAFGGTGFRLDTNGSQKLERKNDTRFIFVDFSVAGVCEDGNFAPAGFCQALKGVDLRFEHQAEDPDMCPLQPGESMPMSIRLSFNADAGHTLLNPALNGSGTTALSLGYGCTHPNLDPSDKADLGLLTRLDEYTWTIEGFSACLFTWGGSKLVDEYGNTVYLDMPFEITIVDVNAH